MIRKRFERKIKNNQKRWRSPNHQGSLIYLILSYFISYVQFPAICGITPPESSRMFLHDDVHTFACPLRIDAQHILCFLGYATDRGWDFFATGGIGIRLGRGG